MPAPRILVVGSSNTDMIIKMDRIPRPGETIVGGDFFSAAGGKGANQAVAAARLGYPVQMIGAVGAPSANNADVFGAALIENLKNAGVGTESIERIPGPSGVAPILIDDQGQNSIVVISGANGKVTPAFVHRYATQITSAGMVLCQLELPLETVAAVLELCAKAGTPVMLDPAPAAPLPALTFKQVAWFTPNETEAALYTGSELAVEAAARELLAMGLAGVVLKRGSEGAFLATADGKSGDAKSGEGKSGWIKPFPVKAIDTVGAGDCFNGAFAVALLEGLDPLAAARFASAAAALSVTRKGAQASMPTRAEVDAFLATHPV
jgi:ribokinase